MTGISQSPDTNESRGQKRKDKMGKPSQKFSDDWITFSPLVRVVHPGKHLPSGENRGLPRMIFSGNTGLRKL